MGLFGLWSKPDDNASIQKLLAQLQDSILKREQQLAVISKREGRAVVYFTLYSSAFWIIYSLLWWFSLLPVVIEPDHPAFDFLPLVRPLPVALLPVIIIFTRRAFRWHYRRQRTREESALKRLRTQQKEEVDKLKKRTKYDETRSLIEKYDESRRPVAIPGTPRSHNATPAGSPATRGGMAVRGGRGGAPNAPSTPVRGHVSQKSMPEFGQSPQARGWVDRVAEALLGDNEQSATSKYALICQKCHNHNGLVLKEELSSTPYVCYKCGHLNPAKAAPMPPLLEHESAKKLRPAKSSPNLPETISRSSSTDSSKRSFPAEPDAAAARASRLQGSEGVSSRRSSPLMQTRDDEEESDEEPEAEPAGDSKSDELLRRRNAGQMETDSD